MNNLTKILIALLFVWFFLPILVYLLPVAICIVGCMVVYKFIRARTWIKFIDPDEKVN